jgi:hypothetical protein
MVIFHVDCIEAKKFSTMYQKAFLEYQSGRGREVGYVESIVDKLTAIHTACVISEQISILEANFMIPSSIRKMTYEDIQNRNI